MAFPQEISSLDLTLSQQKNLSGTGFQLVSEIDSNILNMKPPIKELTKAPKTKVASQLLEEEKSTKEVYSFVENLDCLLKGVLRAGSVTEFVGLPGSGRTQLCLHLSVSAQIVEYSLSGETMYICTNSDFTVSRLKEIIHNYREKCEFFKDSTENDILKNIYVVNSISSAKEILEFLEYLDEFMKEHKNVTLVIIDSITYPLRLCERAEKTTVIHSIVTKLRHLGKIYDFTAVVTNDMTTIIGPSGSEVVPSLKDTLYHMINNRIMLSKKGNAFQAEILKCSSKFPTICDFMFLDDIT